MSESRRKYQDEIRLLRLLRLLTKKGNKLQMNQTATVKKRTQTSP